MSPKVMLRTGDVVLTIGSTLLWQTNWSSAALHRNSESIKIPLVHDLGLLGDAQESIELWAEVPVPSGGGVGVILIVSSKNSLSFD